MPDAIVINGHRSPTTVQRRDSGGLVVRQGGATCCSTRRNSTSSLHLSAINRNSASWRVSPRKPPRRQATKSIGWNELATPPAATESPQATK